MKITLNMPAFGLNGYECHTVEVELLPCPFCEGESELITRNHCGGSSANKYEYTPRCTKTSCAGRLTKKWLNKVDAINAWNGNRVKKIEYKGVVI